MRGYSKPTHPTESAPPCLHRGKRKRSPSRFVFNSNHLFLPTNFPQVFGAPLVDLFVSHQGAPGTLLPLSHRGISFPNAKCKTLVKDPCVAIWLSRRCCPVIPISCGWIPSSRTATNPHRCAWGVHWEWSPDPQVADFPRTCTVSSEVLQSVAKTAGCATKIRDIPKFSCSMVCKDQSVHPPCGVLVFPPLVCRWFMHTLCCGFSFPSRKQDVSLR